MTTPALPIDTPPLLEVRDVDVVYPGRRNRRSTAVHAVRSASLHVRQREIVGLVGESGSGKSTLGLAVLGLVPIASGAISLDAADVQTPGRPSKHRRAAAQMVFQDPAGSLDPRQSVGSGLRELRRLHPKRTDWIDDQALIESVGLDESFLPRYPHQVSGGQAQRIVIARSLLLRPSLLIADEPTSSLDVSVQAQILGLLKELVARFELGLLFISHDLSVVRYLCERVHVMLRGEIVESGSVDEVFRQPQHPYTQRLLAAIPGRSASGDGPVRHD